MVSFCGKNYRYIKVDTKILVKYTRLKNNVSIFKNQHFKQGFVQYLL